MSLRLKITLAFFLLAILPLTGIVLFSYESSRRALRASNEAGARAMASELDERMASIQDDLRRRFDRLAAVRWHARDTADATVGEREAIAAARGEEAETQLVRGVLQELGEYSEFIEAFEFVPAFEPPLAAPRVVRSEAEPAPAPLPAPEPSTPPPGDENGLEIRIEGGDREATEDLVVPVADFVLRQIRGLAEGDPRAERELEESMKALTLDILEHTGEELGGEPTAGDGEPSEPGDAEAPTRPVFRRWTAYIERQYEAHRSERTDPESRWVRIEALDTLGETGTSGPENEPTDADSADADTADETGPRLTDRQRAERRAALDRELARLAPDLGLPVLEDGAPVGELRARVRSEELLRRVLDRIDRAKGEIPFALDPQGRLFTLEEEHAELLEPLLVGTDTDEGRRQALERGWVIVRSGDDTSTTQDRQARGEHDTEALTGGLEFGIARPIGEPLSEVRRAAQRNFGFGLALIVLALVGVLPLTHHMTRDLRQVTESAGRIANGELATRVPVRSTDEVGQLARAFNHMAGRLVEHEQKLVEAERRRHDREMERQLLEAEYARKSRELEEARQFQLSLLPKKLPRRDDCTLAVHMEIAQEVGGDYYDLFGRDGTLVLAVGDATGHGARAGTMVTVTKSLVSSYVPGEGPAAFLRRASQTIRRMDLGRMAMALLLAEWRHGHLLVAAAGMPPLLVYRANEDTVQEIVISGLPLGSRLDAGYRDHTIELAPGDTLLLQSDGFPELIDSEGEPMGYDRARQSFLRAARRATEPDHVITALARDAEAWQRSPKPSDDVTFVVLRAT